MFGVRLAFPRRVCKPFSNHLGAPHTTVRCALLRSAVTRAAANRDIRSRAGYRTVTGHRSRREIPRRSLPETTRAPPAHLAYGFYRSKDCGASNLACCRLNSDPLGPLIEATTAADTSYSTSTTQQTPSRTSTQRPQRKTTTTREPDVGPDPERQCRCVSSKECLVKTYDNVPDIDIR